MKKVRRDERFALRFSREEKAALERLSLKLDLTPSQLVRRGIKHIIAQHSGAASR
jgi:predicted DNA-binding protein